MVMGSLQLFNKEGVEITETDWFLCTFRRKKSSVAKFLKKGTQVYVQGSPSILQGEFEKKPTATMTISGKHLELLSSNKD